VKRIRTLCLFAVTALTLTASLGSVSASASQFVSESVSTDYAGSIGGENHLIVFGSSWTHCNPQFSASPGGKALKPLETDEVSGSCLFGGEFPMKWGSCQLIFHPGSEVSAGKFNGSFDIGPSGCGSITLESSSCAWTVPAQTGLKASFTNEGTGSKRTIKVKAEATGIKYTRSKKTCGEGTHTNGTWSGFWMLKGTVAGSQVGVYVGKGINALYMDGEVSAEEANQPRFASLYQPASISGGVAKNHVFKYWGSLSVTCTSAQLTSTMAEATTDLSVNASYSGCTGPMGLPTTVTMNSCSYVFHVANALPLYTGSTDIACSKAGDAIEFIAKGTKDGGTVCTLSFPAQTIGTASYESVFESENAHVLAEVVGSGVKSTRTGSPLCGAAVSETGTFSGGFALYEVE